MPAQVTYTLKPTDLPGCNPKTNRSVYHEGMLIGRIMLIEHGLREGQWSWTGRWVGPDNRGMADTLDQALGALEARHKELTPEEIRSLTLFKSCR